MSGEVNRVKMVRELGVSINTVYNVTTDLSSKGYVLSICEKPKKSVTHSLSSLSSSSHQTHQKAESDEDLSESDDESSEFTQEVSEKSHQWVEKRRSE
ncbi:hypothetical protein MUP37_03415 [Candidatus Bathyarchaeota archaeon]|nr:hypothetical protein [Candidatus Bathyarchaeota archaeon]